MLSHALRLPFLTVAVATLFATVNTLAESAVATDPCDVTAPESACIEATAGHVSIDLSERRDGRAGSTRIKSIDGRILDPVVAVCLDARAEAVRRGVPIPASVE